MKHNLHAIREGTMKVVFLLTACISILAVALICIFLFANGIPTMHKIGLGKFLFGMVWAPNQDLYGIFPMIIASILVTGGAILIGGPGAIFWMWIIAFFGMATIYAEAVLAQRYRTTVNGKVTGGPPLICWPASRPSSMASSALSCSSRPCRPCSAAARASSRPPSCSAS
mgnify:CR=1 FL=1